MTSVPSLLEMYGIILLSSYTARVLVQSSQWRKCLRQILPNGEPILNEIIRRMPGKKAEPIEIN